MFVHIFSIVLNLWLPLLSMVKMDTEMAADSEELVDDIHMEKGEYSSQDGS